MWLVALVVTLVVPALHEGDRDWWPWTCVAGLVLGAMGWAYLRRGRGNAQRRRLRRRGLGAAAPRRAGMPSRGVSR